MDPRQLKELLTLLKEQGVRKYSSGEVLIEFAPGLALADTPTEPLPPGREPNGPYEPPTSMEDLIRDLPERPKEEDAS